LQKNDRLYSYHIFMFPFYFKTNTKKSTFDKIEDWEKQKFQTDTAEAYSEFVYFYSYVREVLYGVNNTNVSEYYKYTKSKQSTYTIEAKGKSYILDIDNISLRIFYLEENGETDSSKDHGIGILSFFLKNSRYDSFEDILRINDFGRRIYPQFLTAGCNPLSAAQNVFHPCRIIVDLYDNERFEEDFSYYRDFESLKKTAYRLPLHITGLLQKFFDPEKLEVIIDDRMYVMCHYLNDGKASQLTKTVKDFYQYETDGDWYRYVFVDNDSLNCQNSKMLNKLISSSTYDRWSNYSTLYGVTRYSFMLLSKNDSFSMDVLNLHMRAHYFQMATLLLSYRAMILLFSDEVGDSIENNKNLKNRSLSRAKRLFREYLFFQNKIYFKEITAQDQGIELFDLGRKQMRLDDALRELDHDIAELHNFVDMQEEKERNERLELISKIGAVFLPPTLLAGMFGMNYIDFDQHNFLWKFLATAAIVLSGVFGYGIVISSSRWKRLLGLIAMVSIMLGTLLCYPEHPVRETNGDNNITMKGTLCQNID